MKTEPRIVQLPAYEFNPVNWEKFEADFPDGPDPIDAAYWQGFTEARDEYEAESREMALELARLQSLLNDARNELDHFYHD